MSDINSDSRNGFKLVSKYRNALMGLATIWIFVFHTWIPIFNQPENQFFLLLHHIEEFTRKTGFYGVDLFLLLSGMGLTFAINKASLKTFYYRRIRRVILPFLVAALISWPVRSWTFGEFIGNASGFNFYTKYIHIFCWFVPAIITFYLFFPLYFKIFCKAKNKFLFTTLVVFLWLLLAILLHGTIRFDLYGFLNRIPVFIIGVLLGDIVQREKETVFTPIHYLLSLLALIAGLFLAYMYTFEDFRIVVPGAKLILPGILLSISIALLISKLLAVVESHFPKFGKLLSNILGFWGKISLEIYCTYECLLIPFFSDVVKLLAKIGLTILPINLIVFIMSSFVAWISSMLFIYFWKLIELPQKRKIADNNIS